MPQSAGTEFVQEVSRVRPQVVFAVGRRGGVRNSPAAVDALVTANLPLVGYHVSELLGRVPAYVSRDDLASAGSLALVLAAQAYDAETGVPFARYAALRIRGALLDELRSMDWASRGARQRARRVATADSARAAATRSSPMRCRQRIGLAAEPLPPRAAPA